MPFSDDRVSHDMKFLGSPSTMPTRTSIRWLLCYQPFRLRASRKHGTRFLKRRRQTLSYQFEVKRRAHLASMPMHENNSVGVSAGCDP